MVAGLLVGNEMAVGLIVHPTLSRTRDEVHSESVQALARVYGWVMPFWYAANFILYCIVAVVLYRTGIKGYRQAIAASTLMLVTIVFSSIGPAPINNRVALWDLTRLPPEWKHERWLWDVLHFVRVIMLVVSLLLFVAACLASA